MERTEKIEKTVEWLREKVKEANCKGLVVGFPLIRGYGNAVERNLSKRYSREVYRLLKSHLNTGYDMLILIYPGNDSFHSRCDQIRLLCQKAGLIQE